jgi:hypothetical protein
MKGHLRRNVRDLPEAQNLPLIRESLHSELDVVIEYEIGQDLQHKYEKTDCSITNQVKQSLANLKQAYRHFNLVENTRDSKIKRVRMNSAQTKIVESLKIVDETACKILKRINYLLHLIHTRRPRVVTIDEFVEINSLAMWMTNAIQELPRDRRMGMMNEFLVASKLAGVENGVSVVPTDARLYDVSTLGGVVLLHKNGDWLDTTDLQRGEAVWIMPGSESEFTIEFTLDRLHQAAVQRANGARQAVAGVFPESVAKELPDDGSLSGKSKLESGAIGSGSMVNKKTQPSRKSHKGGVDVTDPEDVSDMQPAKSMIRPNIDETESLIKQLEEQQQSSAATRASTLISGGCGGAKALLELVSDSRASCRQHLGNTNDIERIGLISLESSDMRDSVSDSPRDLHPQQSIDDVKAGDGKKVRKLCMVCNENGATQRCCTGKFGAKYCSRECARLDWPNHKMRCTNPRIRTSGRIFETSSHESSVPAIEPVEEALQFETNPSLIDLGPGGRFYGLTWGDAKAILREEAEAVKEAMSESLD